MTTDYTGDAFAAEDLVLTAENDFHLWVSRRPEYMLNMVRKMIRGTFDPSKAIKLWEHYAKESADSYKRQVGFFNFSGAHRFNKPTRRLAAVQFCEDAIEEIREAGGPAQWKAENFPERRN